MIGIGTLMLLLPWAHNGGVGFLEALFTSTSAVCVTGLIVVDTGSEYTVFGQIVILLLIQTGGIGVMSFAGLVFQLFGRRMSLRAQAALSNSMLQREVADEFKGVFVRILYFVLIAEIIGAVLLFIAMFPRKGVSHAAYSAVFHSISAFCNAGFSIYSDSMTGWRGNHVVVSVVMLLIILGGIGHPVAVDIQRRIMNRKNDKNVKNKTLLRLSLTSKVVLYTSGVLIVSGMLLLLFFGLTPGESSLWEKISGSLFQSVTARTAGFNTVDIGKLPLTSIFLLVIWMFIGGSPGSCAGGIKTTTFTLWLAKLPCLLRGEKSPRLFDRHIPGEVMRRVSMIIGLALLWNLAGVLLLLVTETAGAGASAGAGGPGMHDVLFEQVSAFGTVGLSTGLTPQLSTAGRVWIIATMFVGRLGPLTIASWAFTRKRPGIRYPEGRIMIG